MAQEDGVGLLVDFKYILDGDPESMSGMIGLHGEVENLICNSAVNLTMDASISGGSSHICWESWGGVVDVGEQQEWN